MIMQKKICRRQVAPEVYSSGRKLGLSDLSARIVAGRVQRSDVDLARIIRPSLSDIDHPHLLKNSDRTAKRICRAIVDQENIGILTDYDVDGITSHLVIEESLRFFGVSQEKISHFIGHRLRDGYGVSRNLTARILALAKRPDLIITADCGSSDEESIRLLAQAGIAVIVTDHHTVPAQGAPVSAYGVVNPVQAGCGYPDKFISGCMVAWLLMCHVRNFLIEEGRLSPEVGKLSFQLDLVALSTVADAVSLLSASNRAVVLAGLKLLNQRRRPCWRAMAELLNRKNDEFRLDDLGFQIGPRINARGRLADPLAALNFLAAEDDRRAAEWLAVLDRDNLERKAIEREMLAAAMVEAEELMALGQGALVVSGADFHGGVQGIVASRLVEYFGRPAAVFSPGTDSSELSGSARGIDGVHVLRALREVDEEFPGLLLRFGGHHGAAGMTVKKDNFPDFQRCFSQAVARQVEVDRLAPLVWTDDCLDSREITLATAAELDGLAPWGREFSEPVFQGNFRVERLRVVGAEPVHLSLGLSLGAGSFPAIWFRALREPGGAPPVAAGDEIYCAYRLGVNDFKGRRNLQLVILAVSNP